MLTADELGDPLARVIFASSNPNWIALLVPQQEGACALLQVMEVTTRRVETVWDGQVDFVAWSPSGTMLAFVVHRREVWVWTPRGDAEPRLRRAWTAPNQPDT